MINEVSYFIFINYTTDMVMSRDCYILCMDCFNILVYLIQKILYILKCYGHNKMFLVVLFIVMW